MRLSSKGRYGTRLMLKLAIHYGKGKVLMREIAQSEDISGKYLGQIVILLKAAGLINSTRGARGGYALARPPSRIKLGEVIRAVEGPLSLAECVDTPEICPRSPSCVPREVWQEIKGRIEEVLDSITLEDMVSLYKKKSLESPESVSRGK